MTKLRQAAEMALEALEWSYGGEPMPTKELEAINAIRQALAEWTPDDTAYRPDGLSQDELPPVKSYCGGKQNYCEPEMPVDRGAWSDVEDATKWVDELRGDDPATEHWLTKELFAEYLELIYYAIRDEDDRSLLFHKAYWMKKNGEV